MRLIVYIGLLLFFQVQGNNLDNFNNEQCIYSIYKYKYISKAIFQYVPTTIINQTILNLNADIDYYQSKSLSCTHQSFIKIYNLIINPYENITSNIYTDIKQLEKSLVQIFIQTNNILQNSRENILFSNDYKNNTKEYRRIKTIQTNHGRFIGNSIFANYLLNKLFSSTKITCENIINLTEKKLENSICYSTTANLINVNREINFVNQIDQQIFNYNHQNLPIIQLKKQTKHDFDRLLKQICLNNDENSQYQLIDIMNNELDDEELNQILIENPNQYSNCEWTIINQILIKVTRYQVTKYLLKTFSNDETIIEYHFDFIERQSNNDVKEIFKIYLNNSYEISNLIQLRMLIYIDEDNFTIEYILNKNNHWKYRSIAIRILNNSTYFYNQFRILLNNEQESLEIRILAFQNLLSILNLTEINYLIETIQSNQLRYYIKSLFKQSSIWLANSGSYEFPFGKMNIIFNEYLPTIIQFLLVNNTEIDLYFTINSEILLIFGRKSILHFSIIDDFFKWLKKERLFEIETLDGFYLKLIFKINLNQFQNLFTKLTNGISLKIQHGLNNIITGYEINFNIETNFKINIHQYKQSTSYIWRSIQKENILFKIEQFINPFIGGEQILLKNFSSSSSMKNFCYLIPHFDSKICLSFVFERLWPSSIAIRLLSDDPTLIYNLTLSNSFIYFNIQQNEEIFRSYRFIQQYDKHSLIPNYFEFSTPTINYTSLIDLNNQNMISFNLFKNNQSIINGTGVYQYDLINRLWINFTDIHPNHIGKIFINYNDNLTINALQFLGGEYQIQIDRLRNWKHAQIRIKAKRAFFFFKQNFQCNFSYDIIRLGFNLTFIYNENNLFQWIFIKTNSNLNHLFIWNTSLFEINHHIKGYYYNSSNMGIESSSLINGWSLWNISGLINDGKQIQIRLNRIFLNGQIDHRMILFEISYFNQRFFRIFSYINQSNSIDFLFEIPGYNYESQGKFSTNYTNISLHFPIIENKKNHSNINFEFSSYSSNIILNLTSNIRNQYFFISLYNITFTNYYFSQLIIQSSLNLINYQLISFYLFINSIENSTINSSLYLPTLFVSKPFLLTYKNQSQLFIQFFQWANLTRTSINYTISTIFDCQLLIINNLPTKISFHIEQKLLGKTYLLIFEINHNWLISLILNKKIRYEFIFSSINSNFLFKRINLQTNHIDQLPINYYTNNQTLIHIEILFSKYFSTFINDFIFDISLKNHSLKLYYHIPLFKREFFSLTWNRYLKKELFHFHGFIQMKFLYKRRLIDYEYNWNLASMNFWTLNSCLSFLSFDPIEWNFNLTNDYLWYGKLAMDFRLILGNRRELIRFNYKYHYTVLASNLLFNIYLINSHYNLDFNYYHLNHSIQGIFLKNKYEYIIDGYWNITDNSLQLNTQHMKSLTIITSTFLKSIIERFHQKIGFLFQRTINHFTNDSQILECNPYLIIQNYPQLFVIHYYTLNDGLSTMMLEWSINSYLSWNYTGHSQIPISLRKFEIDIRTKYLFRLHTSTFEYSSIYNHKTRQLIIRREPIADDADDRFIMKIKFYHNQTFLFHLQIINNHYKIIAIPSDDNFYWKLHGYFRYDHFNGSLIISKSDWLLSSKLNFNSSLYISTGRYVQLISTSNPQIALEILLKSHFHIVLQYSGLQSLFVFKFVHNTSNINLYFSLISINDTIFNLNFQFNNFLNQNWILKIVDKQFFFNGSLQDFSFQHLIDDKKNEFFFNENSIGFLTNKFHFILSNLSSDTTKYLYIYSQPLKQNLTINYYKSGRFFYDNFNIQTPIYDINILYYPNDDNKKYFIKIFFELLPLQMSSFYFVRGRTFRIGYETQEKQCILSGNLALGIQDIDKKHILIMNQRWKFIYGIEKHEKFYLKWNIKIDLNQKIFQGQINIQDPNKDMLMPIYTDINGYLNDMILVTNIRTIYSSSAKPIILQLNIDQRFMTQQYISFKLIHEFSKTNLSFTIDHYPQRKFLIRLKSNVYPIEKTYVHFYANTTQSQLKLLLILIDLIDFNLTLPKSYPETGLLHSSLFIENKEYFDGRLDTTALKIRTKEYLLNISLNQLILQKKFDQQILASIFARWIDRNSSIALITIFSQIDFQRFSIPIWQSIEQKTWLQRFKQFLFYNNLTSDFFQDLNEFFSFLKTDFINEQGQFGVQLMINLKLDEDFQLGLQRINDNTLVLIETLFQIGLFGEKFLQEYLNNLTCLIHHQNLLHLNISQITTLIINTFTYETIHYVNKTLIMFNYFTHYPRSMNAIINYICNEIILRVYKFQTNFYLETKQYFLSKFIQYTYEIDFLIKISPILSDSITYFSSNDIRTIIYLFNDRLRQLLTIWMNSPIEYKLMKTITSQLIEFIDKFRFYLDDKLDFLLPTLKIYTPQLWINNSINQTFLLTWSKQYNLTNIIDEN